MFHRFTNEAGAMPTTPGTGKIQGPAMTRFTTDAGEPDIGARLPRPAHDRLRTLQRRHDDARDLLHTLTDRTMAAQQDRAHAAAIVRERRQHVGRPITAAAREHAEAELQRAERKLQEVVEVLAELQERAEQTKATRQPIASILRAIDEGLRKAAKVITAGPVQPQLRKGESAAEGVERRRVDVAKLRAKRAKIETAPLPFAEAQAIKDQQHAELVERGRPGLYQLAEAGLPIVWPTMPLQVDLSGGMAMPAGDQAGHHLAGVGHGQTVDALAVLAWLFPDQMARRLDEELKACCSEGEPLTREERAKRLAEIDAEILATEREECALIEAADWTIPYRGDCDWRAVLGVATE